MTDDIQRLAERCAESMYARDRASQVAGMVIDEVSPGDARLSMTLGPEMINGHDTGHGGAIFALADSAFAFACNSRNVATLPQHCSITCVSPGRGGERLTAAAREVNLSGRFGIYDVRVRADGKRVVAIFRCQSAAVRGTVISENGEA